MLSAALLRGRMPLVAFSRVATQLRTFFPALFSLFAVSLPCKAHRHFGLDCEAEDRACDVQVRKLKVDQGFKAIGSRGAIVFDARIEAKGWAFCRRRCMQRKISEQGAAATVWVQQPLGWARPGLKCLVGWHESRGWATSVTADDVLERKSRRS